MATFQRIEDMYRTLIAAPCLTLLFVSITSWAAVTLECDRPLEPAFDHSDIATREAVINSGKKLQKYSPNVQQYIHCLQSETIAERDRMNKVAKGFREENERLSATLIG